MLPSRPIIFISAVTKELGIAREKIADVLRLLHFQSGGKRLMRLREILAALPPSAQRLQSTPAAP